MGGLALVRSKVPAKELKAHHDIAGALLAVVGTLTAILVALTAVEAQSRYQQARIMESTEANALSDLYHLSDHLEPNIKSKLQHDIRTYIEAVIFQEWDTFGLHSEPNRQAMKSVQDIWNDVCGYKPADMQQQDLHTVMLTSVDQLGDSRRYRLFVGNAGIPATLWCALIVGSLVTLAFTFFFGSEKFKLQVIMNLLIALTLSTNIVVIYLLSNPYQGEFKIEPIGMRRVGKAFIKGYKGGKYD